MFGPTRYLLLDTDRGDVVDLSKVLYRATRSLGGSWTEMLHSDKELLELAERWARQTGLESPRICPLCNQGAGTPRHVIMVCPSLAEVRNRFLDLLEAEMLGSASLASLVDAAGEWWERRPAADMNCARRCRCRYSNVGQR